MKKLFILTILLLFWSNISSAAEKHYQLTVNGLVCPFCEFNIEKKLSKIDGVLKVKANLKEGLVSVKMADGKTLPEDIVRQDITDAGFTLKSIKMHQSGKKSSNK